MERLRRDGVLAGMGALLFAFVAAYLTFQSAPVQAHFPFNVFRVSAPQGQPLLALNAYGIPAVYEADAHPGAPLYRTIDHGATFERSGALPQIEHITGMAFDAQGWLYVAGGDEHPIVGASEDYGRTWSVHPVASGSFGPAWMAAQDSGVITVTAVDLRARRLRAWRSADRARTFREAGTIPARNVRAAGPVLVGPYATLHQAFETNDGRRRFLGYAASADGGRTWSAQRALAVSTTGAMPAKAPRIAVDDLGTIYLSWLDGDSARLAISTDHGRTWPVRRALTSTGAPVTPVVVAGGFSKADVAFLRPGQNGAIELAMSQTLDGANLQPHWVTYAITRATRGSFAFIGDLDGAALFSFVESGAQRFARQAAGSRLH